MLSKEEGQDVADFEGAGWKKVKTLPRYTDFPEIVGRTIVHARDFYLRDSERLVVEYESGSADPVAVLLNGEVVNSGEWLREENKEECEGHYDDDRALLLGTPYYCDGSCMRGMG